jgi:hypothetical protein
MRRKEDGYCSDEAEGYRYSNEHGGIARLNAKEYRGKQLRQEESCNQPECTPLCSNGNRTRVAPPAVGVKPTVSVPLDREIGAGKRCCLDHLQNRVTRQRRGRDNRLKGPSAHYLSLLCPAYPD